MRIVILQGFIWVTLCGAVGAHAQGTFRNMSFELAQIPQGTPAYSYLPASTTIAFWNVYLGSSQQSTVLYDGFFLGTAAVILQDGNSQFGTVLEGRYTAVLEAGNAPFMGVVSASIAQTGVIPPGTKSIMFIANPPQGSGWTVTVGDQTIPVTETSQVGSGYYLFAGDVSAFAGQTEELRFTALGGSSPILMTLDSIQFSPIAIPEPTTPAMLAFGGLVLAFRVTKKVPVLTIERGGEVLTSAISDTLCRCVSSED